MSKILVTGATGHLGKAIVEALLKKTSSTRIHVLVRDAAKAADLIAKGVTVHEGNYDDHASLVNAFKGINKVYMVSGNELHKRIQQHYNVVDAAVEAGVKHLVYTSFQRKNETETSPIQLVAETHLKTEEKIKSSGLIYTILEHGIYADMIPIFAGAHLLENHTIYLPAGNGKTAYAVRNDQAEAGAIILLDESGKYDNESIELAGPEAVSWGQVADIIKDITGKPIVYVAPPVDEFNAALRAAHVPDEVIGLMAAFSKAADVGEFDNVNNVMEVILGRKCITLAAYLQQVYTSK
ncbi:SDR family oxidoreductase [Foetidibacter luteolus]|uniref:SDR family oxidoreductase n=1 Tax=Foetidibacter luteolus TaxID=2608880 RepID=UPI00129B390A|nr:SDR family oxidoreductase [Foetidibacter luteolus]